MTASGPGVRSELGREVPAADGTVLKTDVHRPEGRGPVVLLRTPYGTGGVAMLQLGRCLAREGFAAVLQNVRGRHGSGGTFEPFVDEAEDGLATLRWLGEQPWCDGTIVPLGISYASFTAGALFLGEPPPGLRFPGMVSITAMVRPWRHFYRGGALVLHWAWPWSLAIAGSRQRSLSAEELWRHAHAPLAELAPRLGAPPRPWSEWIRERDGESPYWRQRDVLPALRRRALPMLHVGGWYDFSLASTFELFQALAAGDPASQQLIVGPWEHNEIFATLLAELRGVSPASGVPALGGGRLGATFLATLRAWCGGAAMEAPAPVQLWQCAPTGGRWMELTGWPPAGETCRWFLDAPAGCRASGRLRRSPAADDAPGVLWQHDPDNPVPTLGGRCWAMPGWTEAGPLDQRPIHQRDDVVLYTGEPLADDLEVSGRGRVQLTIEAAAGAEIDIWARLVDLARDGSARWVADGVTRWTPGEAPCPVTVELDEIAYRFPRGHRLRLAVAASNFPQCDRTLVAGWRRLLHGGDASWMDLPAGMRGSN